MTDKSPKETDVLYEGKADAFMDVDRMVNEGLGGGNVTREGGLIEDTTTDTMYQTAQYQTDVTFDEVKKPAFDAETESFMKKKNG